MKKITKILRDVFSSFNGVFIRRDYVVVPSELSDMYEKIFFDIEMSQPIEDKINLSKDFRNIKMDLKKSVKEYKETMVNE